MKCRRELEEQENFLDFKNREFEPDAVAIAKGLGGGFPIGGVWIAEKWVDIFTPGFSWHNFWWIPLPAQLLMRY